jgi:hypothetical protein
MRITDFKPGERFHLLGASGKTWVEWNEDGDLINDVGEHVRVNRRYLVDSWVRWRSPETDADKIARLERELADAKKACCEAYKNGGMHAITLTRHVETLQEKAARWNEHCRECKDGHK